MNDNKYNDPDLANLLWLFREFYTFYVTQTKLGANHHHPIWAIIADALSEYNINDMKHTESTWRFITQPHYNGDNNEETAT